MRTHCLPLSTSQQIKLTPPLPSKLIKYSSRASFTNSLPYKCAVRLSGSWRWSHAVRSVVLLGSVTYSRVTILSSSGLVAGAVVWWGAARRVGRLRRIDVDITGSRPWLCAALSLMTVLCLFEHLNYQRSENTSCTKRGLTKSMLSLSMSGCRVAATPRC